jgi:hypothetical protein
VTDPTSHQPATDTGHTDDLREYWPGDTSPAIVAALRDEFPGFHISRELAVGQVRYVACRLHPATHPHTVMSADPDRLRAELRGSRT